MPSRCGHHLVKGRLDCGSTCEADAHPTRFGLVRQIGRLDLQHHRVPDLGSDQSGGCGIPRERLARHRYAVRCQKGLGFSLREGHAGRQAVAPHQSGHKLLRLRPRRETRVYEQTADGQQARARALHDGDTATCKGLATPG